MKSFRALLALGFVAALFAAAPADAAQQMLCSNVANARQVTNYASATVPQPTYNLNAKGCSLIAQADIGYFLTQGFIVQSTDNSIIFTTGALPASGTADIVGPVIPPGAYIQTIIWSNTTANAVTGGMSIGTTANGTDVVAAQALAANALVFTTDALLLKRVFSLTAATPLHFAPITSSNTSNITVTIVYGYF